jgi:hypothetical protein
MSRVVSVPKFKSLSSWELSNEIFRKNKRRKQEVTTKAL